MPIRPEWRAYYRSPEWQAKRVRILKRAGGRFNDQGVYLGGACCERCGRKGQRGRGRTIQVAHLDHNPANDDEGTNLKGLCGKCHLNYDAKYHKLSRSTKKDAARPLLQLAGGNHALATTR